MGGKTGRPRKTPQPQGLDDRIYWKNNSYHLSFWNPVEKRNQSQVVYKGVPKDKLRDPDIIKATNEAARKKLLEVNGPVGRVAPDKVLVPAGWVNFIANKKNRNKQHLKASTKADYESVYRNYIGPIFQNLTVDEIGEWLPGPQKTRLEVWVDTIDAQTFEGTREELKAKNEQQKKDKLPRLLSAKRRNNIVLVMKSYLSFAAKKAWTPINLGEDLQVEGFQNPHFTVPTYDQLMALIRALPDTTVVRTYKEPEQPKKATTPRKEWKAPSTHHYCYRPFVEMALYTGGRAGELVAADWDDIDWKQKTISFRRSYAHGEMSDSTKGHKDRTVPLPDRVIKLLKEWKKVCPDKTILFPSPGGGRFSVDTFRQREWKDATLAAGIPEMRIHDLRHSYITWLVRLNINPLLIQAAAGHSSAASTQIYLDLDAKALRPIAEALNRPKPVDAPTQVDLSDIRNYLVPKEDQPAKKKTKPEHTPGSGPVLVKKAKPIK